MKALKNTNYLVQESGSYDLIEYNFAFTEARRIKGIEGISFEQEAMRTCRHSHDDSHLTIMKGNWDISIIKMIDFTIKDVKEIFGSNKNPEIISLWALWSEKGDRAFAVSWVNGEIDCNYYEKGSKIKVVPRSEIAPRCKFQINVVGIILCLEVNMDSSVVFLGGSTSFDFENGSAIIQAIDFNKKLDYITDLRIEESDNRFISKITRFSRSNKLLVAGYSNIYIYEFKNRKFYKISVILNVHTGTSRANIGHELISDIVIHDNIIYTIAVGDTEISKIEFVYS